ncbi:E3 binding domain-containing protein [Streptomyces sp. WI03-4A]|uniref:biotin/lipoyl-containing protein n=1 Tax=Streptomyces sp. WI03-4A TaxID=3028706 RepID=UPI0029AF006F|nr:biotin/lipoyl-containing protein [Streptomyces sp. WI03-4A]MDX2591367.1 E3 binding domain-containing protein [Streptomyces sp. WI03-4A]
MTTPDTAGTASEDTTECVFVLPDLGEGLVSAEIMEWLVAVGDVVEIDQPVVVVETVKSTVELPSPYRGRITVLHADVTRTVPVGAPLVSVIGPRGQQPPAGGTTHLVGQTPPPAAGAAEHPARRLPAKGQQRGRVTAAPVVRRLARELGVELRDLTGTGDGGAITKDDVRAAAATAGQEDAS